MVSPASLKERYNDWLQIKGRPKEKRRAQTTHKQVNCSLVKGK
jgi:hypothetical protein